MRLFSFWQARDLPERAACRFAIKAFAIGGPNAADDPVVSDLRLNEAKVSHWTTLSFSNEFEVGHERAARAGKHAVPSMNMARFDAARALDAYATDKKLVAACRRLIRRNRRRVLQAFASGALFEYRGRAAFARLCGKCSGGQVVCTRCFNAGGPRHLTSDETCQRCDGTGFIDGFTQIYTGWQTDEPGWYDKSRWMRGKIPCPVMRCRNGRIFTRRPNPNYCPECKGRRRVCSICGGHAGFVTLVAAAKVWTVTNHQTREINPPKSNSRRRADSLGSYGDAPTVELRQLPRLEAVISSETPYRYWTGKIQDSKRAAEFEICGKEISLVEMTCQSPAPFRVPLFTGSPGANQFGRPANLPVRFQPHAKTTSALYGIADFFQKLARLFGA